MNQFSDLSLSAVLHNNLATHGFVQPTTVQAQSIPPALEGRDLVATAQTGTGKTLAFVLPLLQKLATQSPRPAGVQAIILSPTRELAIQIQETFARLAAGTGIHGAVVVGGLNEQRQLLAIRKGAQVLIATPGRLQDFLQRRLVRLGNVQVAILDEADRMLDMGFLPVIEQILAATPSARQTLFYSATIESSVAHLIQKHLSNPVRVAVGAITKPSEQVDLHGYEIEQDRKLGLLETMLQNEHGSFLVFARTKHGADRLARKLEYSGVSAASIHGDRTQSQRNRALDGFKRGHYRVLVATDVAARGVHVEGIAHVVNFDLPQVPEDFIHRVGRTGRAGSRGIASTFFTRSERGEIHRIERVLKTRLLRREIPAGIQAEHKRLQPANVVVMPNAGSPAPRHLRFSGRPPQSANRRPSGQQRRRAN
jgi:ATP-dependent RNA helicase RhlE